jgi:hypothetical protein
MDEEGEEDMDDEYGGQEEGDVEATKESGADGGKGSDDEDV